MSVMELIDSMGSDAVLLTRNDEWLERQRLEAAKQIDELANNLRALMLAQRIKGLLQQRNLVAVQHILKNENGTIKNILVRLLPLPEAMRILQPSDDALQEINRTAQIKTWKEDGYDIETSSKLRTA